MKKTWLPEELVEHWTLLSHELALLTQKNDENRLGFAILLKFFQYTASFPDNSREIPAVVVNYVAKLLDISPEKYQDYNWQGRSIKYHRAQIRDFFGFREATVNDASSLANWLTEQALIYELKFEQLKLASLNHLRELKIEPPTLLRLERIINSALHTFESNFFRESSEQLSSQSKEQIDNLLNLSVASQELDDISNENGTSFEPSKTSDICETSETATWAELKTDPGRIGVESFQKEIAKLEIFRQLKLPVDLFKKIPTKVLQIYKARVAVEHPRDLRRHPEAIRYTLFAAFCWLRSQEVIDNLVELLIQIVHRIGANAEKRIDKELLKDFKRIHGKNNLLYQMAEASLNTPDGAVKDVIFPVVSEATLKNLVKEYKSTGNAYREKVYTVMRASYGGYYRRILPLILEQLEFRSNNEVHRPVIQALELLKKYADSKQRYYESGEYIPIEVQKRLLLCLYGLGTNTGLKRLSDEMGGDNYHDLLHVKRRFIHKDQLRNAIACIANAIFRIRIPQIWGEGTTACASDSKKFGSWDQNLMTEWHIRYGGRGVMIYWHVEKNSVCIYSQLKTCSSSEVAA